MPGCDPGGRSGGFNAGYQGPGSSWGPCYCSQEEEDDDLEWTCPADPDFDDPDLDLDPVSTPRWVTNTTDLVFDASSFSLNRWILDTHHQFLEQR